MLHFPTWKKILISTVCVIGFFYALPNLFSEGTFDGFPDWMPGKQINLGLDLQGGSHLLLEVEVETVVREQLESMVDALRITLRTARVRYSGLGIERNGVVFRLRDPERIEAIREQVEGLNTDTEVTVNENGFFRLELTEEAIRERRNNAVSQSIEIVRRRIDETGTREPTIQRQGKDRILVQLPGVKDPERVKRLLGKTAKLTFHLVNASQPYGDVSTKVPPGIMLLSSDDPNDNQRYMVRKRIELSGDTLVDAQPTFQDNQPVVSFRFNTLGARKFGNITRKNVGRLLAIVLDGKVISAPSIREPIQGGSGIITGQFTTQEVRDLALLLRAGALPAPLNILEERTVGPGLGQDSIDAGQIASIIGIILVTIFMILVYGRFGVMADFALFLNLVLIVAVLSVLQATLTLPGVAGIVLTIGMAVDANVLIFERIRDEVSSGRTPISAVESGYRRAITTIIDSNLTTLIAAILLYAFGSGPVKGFAVTLAIGIVTSMFTAVMVTRMVLVTWLRRTRPQELPI